VYFKKELEDNQNSTSSSGTFIKMRLVVNLLLAILMMANLGSGHLAMISFKQIRRKMAKVTRKMKLLRWLRDQLRKLNRTS